MEYGDDDGLKEDVESGLEEAGARMRCLAFMDPTVGAQLGRRLQSMECVEDADIIAAITALSKSMSEVCGRLSPLLSVFRTLFSDAAIVNWRQKALPHARLQDGFCRPFLTVLDNPCQCGV